MQMLALGDDGIYHLQQHLTAGDTLTSDLFPGLRFPLDEVFRFP